jgi:hypothetical protein
VSILYRFCGSLLGDKLKEHGFCKSLSLSLSCLSVWGILSSLILYLTESSTFICQDSSQFQYCEFLSHNKSQVMYYIRFLLGIFFLINSLGAFVSWAIVIVSVNKFGYFSMGFVSKICCSVLKLPFLGD